MIRRILYLLLSTVILGGLGGAIAFYAFDFKPKMLAEVILGAPVPPETVSAEAARTDTWQPQISGIGTLTAFQGIDITPQVGGIVTEVNFVSGEDVPKGKLLVKLDAQTEEADMRSILAELANTDMDLIASAFLKPRSTAAVRKLHRNSSTRRGTAASASRTSRSAAIWRPVRRSSGCRRSTPSTSISPCRRRTMGASRWARR